MRTLYLSYDNLPLNLKLCFLSFSYYPEDEYIEVDDLIRWWIIEVMVRPEEARGMGEIALDYLKDLIGRNMIFVIKYNEIMEIEHIGIHDLLLELCRKELAIENLCVGEGMDTFFKCKKKSSVDIHAMRCVGCSTTYFTGFCDIDPVSNSSTRLCYGRIFHQIHSILPINDYVCAQLCVKCNKVVMMELFIYGVLLHPTFSVSSISKCKEIKVPHFRGMNKDIIPFKSLEQYNFSENLLWNVQQCSCLGTRSCRMMPQVKVLDGLLNQDEEDIVLEQFIGIPSMEYASEELFLPISIKRLGICGHFFTEIQSAIWDMPNLEYLALRFCYHIGTTIVGSHSLRYLGISDYDDAKGRLEIDCPRLERVWLHSVGRLRSIHLCDDSSLQSIRLEGCGESIVQWAMEILEKKRSLGDNNFYVEMDGRMQFDWSKRVWKICRSSMLLCREGLEDQEFPLLEMMICTQLYHRTCSYKDVIKYLSGFHKDRQREHFFLLRSIIDYREGYPIPNRYSSTAVRFPNLKVVSMGSEWDGSPLPSLLKKLYLRDTFDESQRRTTMELQYLRDTLIDEARTRTIMELQYLEVLELRNCTFENEEWCNLSQGQFTKLKHLKIYFPRGVKSLKVEEGQFPQLLTLLIFGWKDDICDITCNITTLSSIQLWGCGGSTIRSAKKILRERRNECGDEDFIVMVGRKLLTLEEEEKEEGCLWAWDGAPLSSLLKKLELFDTLIDEARTRAIMELHNLEVLKFDFCIFVNEEWCNLSQGQFTKLKELMIHYSYGLKSLKVEQEQFPQLLSLRIVGVKDCICDITRNITTLLHYSIGTLNCGTIRGYEYEYEYDWEDCKSHVKLMEEWDAIKKERDRELEA